MRKEAEAALFRKAGLLSDEVGMHLLPLIVLLFKRYGAEYIEWPWEALEEQLREDFGDIGPVTADRIQAGRVLVANDLAWTEWEIFENVVAATEGEPVTFSEIQPSEPEFVAMAVYTMSSIDQHPFSDEVKAYILAVCLDNELWYLEGPLDVAKPMLLEYDKENGIERPWAEVESLLSKRREYIQSPTSHAEYQFNQALSVRLALHEYEEQLKRDMLTSSTPLPEGELP